MFDPSWDPRGAPHVLYIICSQIWCQFLPILLTLRYRSNIWKPPIGKITQSRNEKDDPFPIHGGGVVTGHASESIFSQVEIMEGKGRMAAGALLFLLGVWNSVDAGRPGKWGAFIHLLFNE